MKKFSGRKSDLFLQLCNDFSSSASSGNMIKKDTD